MENLQKITVIGLYLCLLGHPSKCLQKWGQLAQDTEVNPGQNVTLPCFVRNQGGVCSWERDGRPVGRWRGKYEWSGSGDNMGDCSIHIMAATEEYDSGRWQCQVTASSYKDRDAMVSPSSMLLVRRKPGNVTLALPGTSTPDGDARVVNNKTVEMHTNLTIQCWSQAKPPPSLTWQIPQSMHILKEKMVVEDDRTVSTLSIARLDHSSGFSSQTDVTVTCAANHPTLQHPIKASFNLDVLYAPTVEVFKSSKNSLGGIEGLASPQDGGLAEEDDLTEGDEVVMNCVADSRPQATTHWIKEGVEGVWSHSNQVKIGKVARQNAGNYSCVATNHLGTIQSKYINIKVKYAPVHVSAGPSPRIERHVGSSVTLTCSAQSYPPPLYLWHQEILGPAGTHKTLIRGNQATLTLHQLQFHDGGMYVCTASNRIRGKDSFVQSRPVSLSVTGPPTILSLPTRPPLIIHSGQDATFDVRYCGVPEPKVTWQINQGNAARTGYNKVTAGYSRGNSVSKGYNRGNTVTSGRFITQRIAMKESNCFITRLQIVGAHVTDSHSYQVLVENALGFKSWSVELLVQDARSLETVVAVGVGAVLTLLVLTLSLVYALGDKCRCNSTDKLNQINKSEKPDVCPGLAFRGSNFPAFSPKTDLFPDIVSSPQHENIQSLTLPYKGYRNIQQIYHHVSQPV